MGGSIAGYFAGAYPERVHRLVLVEGLGPPEPNLSPPARVVAWLDAWRRVRGKEQRSYASVDEAAEQMRKHDPKLGAALALRLASHGTARGEDGRYRFKHDPLHVTPGPYGYSVDVAMRFWSAVRSPVLLVEGGDSVFRHSQAETARRAGAFAHHESAVVPGAGHMVQRHQPAALAALVRPFLERT
jgi:pimeloyl-ACP methyl ester carboxylesterase